MDFRQEYLQLLADRLPAGSASQASPPDAFDIGSYPDSQEQLRALRSLAKERQALVDQLTARLHFEKLTVQFAKKCADFLESNGVVIGNNSNSAAGSGQTASSGEPDQESDTETLCEETGSLRDYLRDETADQQVSPKQPEPEYSPLVEVQRRKQSGRRKKPPPPPVIRKQHQQASSATNSSSGGSGSNKISVDACFSVYSEPPAAESSGAEPLYEELLRSLVAEPPEPPPCPESEKSRQRYELAQRVLKEETFHLNILKVLQQYSNALQLRVGRNKPELVQQLFYRHLDLAKQALVKLETSAEFRDMFKTNVKSGGNSAATPSSEKFMIAVANPGGSMEEISVSDAIAMPAKWLVTHSENCKMLSQLTPESHDDRRGFQSFCDQVRRAFEDLSTGGGGGGGHSAGNGSGGAAGGAPRRLLKQQMVVELCGSHSQKLRRLFLFTDALVCARQKLASNGEFDLVLKWYIPKSAFVLFDQRRLPSDFENKRKETVNGLKAKIKQVQSEIAKLKVEASTNAIKGPDMRNFFKTSASRRLDRSFDQLKKLQGQLIVSVPSLPLKVGRINEKQYVLLLSSELEKREWETLLSETLLQNYQTLNSARPAPMTVAEATELLAAHRYVARGVTDLGYHYLKKSPSPAESEDDMDNEGLIGTLKVVIHKIEGLVQAGSYGVAIELNDLSHHYCRIHATQFVEQSLEPIFEKEFQIQLDGTESSIRFVVTRLDEAKRSVNVGHLDLRLYSASLKDYYAKCHYLTQADRSSALLLTLSLDFVPSLLSLTREAPPGRAAVFGAPLSQLVDSAGAGVPRVVQSLTRAIEKRIDELGIYRISGSSLDLQEVKATIDASPEMACRALDGVAPWTCT
uniref:Rho-GAP domain-containing protein n=1 Tax=Macrostomum lignano TaxID=282301 RepID=A0A1I8J5C7_9PLAT